AQELSEFRAETRENFEKVETRFDGVETRFDGVETRLDGIETRLDGVETRLDGVETRLDGVETRLGRVEDRLEQFAKDLTRQIDRLGSRWGIRNESLFRETVTSLLGRSFGVSVETRHIAGEQFDLIISDGQHILIEIAASAERDIQERLERKRRLYTETTGVVPARVIFAVASIHSRLAQTLRESGIEVVEPEE
ncbi:MAG: DUF3782 domain-containing protein, partial [Chloroflexi bacterium]|nr:DUF3782 domain-containing protein [Chloroflexota bacterium]